MYLEAKEHLLATLKNSDRKWFYLYTHIPQVEKWAKKIASSSNGVDSDVLLTAVWLHDIGQLLPPPEKDHAQKSEAEVKVFLKSISMPEETIEKVAHCVRAHRCKDVQPQSLEAKILAVADSASHLTDSVYTDFAKRGELRQAQEKLERDFRDIGLIPQVQKEITPLYIAWKKLLEVFPKQN